MPSNVLETPCEVPVQDQPVQHGFVTHLDEIPVEGGSDPTVGTVTWKTLICADRTQSSEILLGVAEFPPHGVLNLHRHEPAEYYFCTSGHGIVSIDGVDHEVRPGAAVFVPGNAEHGVWAGEEGMTFVYGFSKDAFSQVSYAFSSQDNVVQLSTHRTE